MADNVSPLPGVVDLELAGPEIAVFARELLNMLALAYAALGERVSSELYDGLPESLGTDEAYRLHALSVDMRVAERAGETFSLVENEDWVRSVLVAVLKAAAQGLKSATQRTASGDAPVVHGEALRVAIAIDLLDRIGWSTAR